MNCLYGILICIARLLSMVSSDGGGVGRSCVYRTVSGRGVRYNMEAELNTIISIIVFDKSARGMN